jgi:lysyl-tRNA synthetase class 2
VTDFTLLAKSLRPPPDKHHGLSDVETRFRRRELDLIANEETRELFIARARIISAVRRALDDAGFVEVETPVLQPLYGGARRARSRPTTTRSTARSTCGSRPSSTSSARSSAASSASTSSARTSATRASRPSTTPSSRCSSGTRPTPTTRTGARGSRRSSAPLRAAEVGRGPAIDFAAPWRRVTLARRDPRAPASTSSRCASATRSRRDRASGLAIETDGRTWPPARRRPALKHRRADAAGADLRLRLPGRALAARQGHRSEPGYVERWEAFAGGIEIANAFSELNDPDEQRARFVAQRERRRGRRRGGSAVRRGVPEALEQGMPPTGGVGPRHRPPRDAALRRALDPRGRPVSRDARS